MLPALAGACSCSPGAEIGFIHADVEHLPANARGALFLQSEGSLTLLHQADDHTFIYSGRQIAVTPASFSITSDNSRANLRVELSYPDILSDQQAHHRHFRFKHDTDEAAFEKNPQRFNSDALIKAGKLTDISAEIRRFKRLVRVGPAGGFKAGQRYTIRYVGTDTAFWNHPAMVNHTIDAARVDTEAGRYALALDGGPRRQLVQTTSRGGSCSSQQAVAGQDFHYTIPETHKPYGAALLYFSQLAPAHGGGQAKVLFNRTSGCDRPAFGQTTRAGGHDYVTTDCTSPGGPIRIKGMAGFLEVDDKLEPTNTLAVDFSATAGTSCEGFGIFNAALQSRNRKHIKAALCALEDEELDQPTPTVSSEVAKVSDLMTLGRDSDAGTRQCAERALKRLVLEAPAVAIEALIGLGELLPEKLLSTDERQASDASEQLYQLISKVDDGTVAIMLHRALLKPRLKNMVDALISGKTPIPSTLAKHIAAVGPDAISAGPALLKAAEAPTEGAGHALRALAGIIPNDPAFHALLLRSAKRNELVETSADIYNDVAGAKNRNQAIVLLTQAARLGSGSAIQSLGEAGAIARTSIPVLMEQLQHAENEDVRCLAYMALLSMAPEREALAAISLAINAPADRLIPEHILVHSNLTVTRIRAMAQAIEARATRPMTQAVRLKLIEVVEQMPLPSADRATLMARLKSRSQPGST